MGVDTVEQGSDKVYRKETLLDAIGLLLLFVFAVMIVLLVGANRHAYAGERL
jgi:hypothetical protein